MTFLWGTATSAHQIEGASGDREPSIWDAFEADPDHIADGSTAATACDHVHRYREDVGLLGDLGANAYRFSVSWPRLRRDGPAFYDRLVDALLEHGIAPVATLYHWDLPASLQAAGGWSNRETASRFAEYADALGRALGDRVALWLTLNEPVVHLIYGHLWGLHAPGLHLFDDPFPVAHHQLLAHGLAVQALRGHTTSPIGLVNNYTPSWAVGPDGQRSSATDEDRAAARVHDMLHNRLFTEPVLLGRYPDGLPWSLDALRDDDLDVIATPVDALGVNYYNPFGVGAPSEDNPFGFDMRLISGYPLTYFGWPVVPHALRDLLVDLWTRYHTPLYVTENGAAYADDADRIAYLDAHVSAVDEARERGADVRGYFVWSLLDNFEWAEGYTKRFGLVDVDFGTLARTPRGSYDWYRRLIRSRRSVELTG